MDFAVKTHRINGIDLTISDHFASKTTDIIASELNQDCYKFSQMAFSENDNVIDVGGHVGMVSIFLAKKYPFINIYSFEPCPGNYHNFLKNIELNQVKNIHLYNKAVTKDGRKLLMALHCSNTGGATSQMEASKMINYYTHQVDSIDLDKFLEETGIEKCKLLKIDCEGSEYEILLNLRRLGIFEYLTGEVHLNAHLSSQGYSLDTLYKHCQAFIKPENITFVPCSKFDCL
ncbi:FkbM family methyltransferase [Dendrosporobacter sp. 1207_IL3150]|uniref:FkbM family methyltransferase n=1 Tax=Dendrosporobacter sp. 1207_IL3150 TaxID=3084054 RepID=UPI002FD91D4A